MSLRPIISRAAIDPNFEPLFGRRTYNDRPSDDPTITDETLSLTPPEPSTPPTEDPLKAPGLKALEAERAANKSLKDQLKALEDKFLGIDPTTVANLKKTAEEREQADLEAKSQYAAALKNKEEKYNADLQNVRLESQKLQRQLEQQTIEQAAIDSFIANGGKRAEGITPKSFVQLLLPAIDHRLKVIDGEVIVVDPDGEPAWNKETFKPVTLDDLMAECRAKGATASLFDPIDKASGAGAYGNRKISNTARAELDNLSGAAKLARARQLGLA